MKENLLKILKHRKSLPGIQLALDFINDFNYVIPNVKKGVESKYYNYCVDMTELYDYGDFNMKFQNTYTSELIYRKLIIYNELYIKMSNLYNGRYSIYNYKYRDDNFNCHDLLNYFIRNLRYNYDGTFIFAMKSIFEFLKPQFFADNVAAEQQCRLIAELMFDLEDHKIVEYDYANHTVKFNFEYQNDLLKLMYSSFDTLVLGRQEMCKVFSTKELLDSWDIEKIILNYSNLVETKKIIINDLLFNLVISQCTDFISFSP